MGTFIHQVRVIGRSICRCARCELKFIDDLSASFLDFLQAAPHPSDSAPKTETAQSKEDAARQLEAAWKDRIPLARFVIDLGRLPCVPPADETAGTSSKRALDDSSLCPAPKKVRLDGGATRAVMSQCESDPLALFRATALRVMVRPLGNKTMGYQPEPGHFAMKLERHLGPTQELHFAKAFSDEEELLLRSALTLCDVNERSRARTFAYIGQDATTSSVKLMLEFCWKNGHALTDTLITTKAAGKNRAANLLLSKLYPEPAPLTTNKGPRLFYESVHVPEFGPDDEKPEIEVPGLQTGLYPFQQRSVSWMLKREEGGVGKSATASSANGFRKVRDVNGDLCGFNPWLQLFTTDETVIHDSIARLRGGILAEEMGLGKTVELISLIQLHKRDKKDLGSQNGLYRTGATLVVAPRTIISQWQAEIATHCPTLSVMVYSNAKPFQASQNKLSEAERIEIISSHDVVLCDYIQVQKELHFVSEPPQRSRRNERRYDRPKSLLTQINWWRVVLDEAQSIETPTTQAAKVVVQIPRTNAWAVTGTPLKKAPSDLLGLFMFLGLEPYALSATLFDGLINNFGHIFEDLIGRTVLRHTKDLVKADLQLPPQKRIVISVPFTVIEEQNYNELFETMAIECGLNLDGSPTEGDWDPDDPQVISTMRDWLARLRKVCLHPEVGARLKQGRNGREAPLRTVGDVLSMMLETNDANLRTEERVRLQSMLLRGQILEQAKRPADSLAIWQMVLNDIKTMVADDRKEISAELIRGKSTDEESGMRISSLRNRLRAVLELQHSATFFIANAFYQLKTDSGVALPGFNSFEELEAKETSCYDEAKLVRRELMSASSDTAQIVLDKIRMNLKADKYVKIKALKGIPSVGGIQSQKHIDTLSDIADTLNQGAELLDELREKLCQAVLSPLVDQDDTELTGEEYEQSTLAEDEIHAYMEALRLLVADRAQLVTGQRNMNVRRNAAELYRRALASEGHSPRLMKDLLSRVNGIRPPEVGHDQELKFVLSRSILQLKHLHDMLDGRGGRAAEVAIVTQLLDELKPQHAAEVETVSSLEKELEFFSNAVNVRVEYYRQLQIISDMVAPFEQELTEQQRQLRLQNMEKAETNSAAKISRLRSRAKYLQHLKADPDADSEERRCYICTEFYENGILTSCGHRHCKNCIQLWWAASRNCPVCKQSLKQGDLYPITYRPVRLSVQEDVQTRSPSADAASETPEEVAEQSLYVGIDNRSLDEIKTIDLPRSYGTKIDMLARHIIWLREREPGTKSVIFSQFPEFFTVLEDAFDKFKIGWASLAAQTTGAADSVRRFKTERKVEVLFLHAKAQAAGLNLINATHVFLCEPLLNTAIELQAIARVHRIGQHHTTTIWQYLIENTVEKAIYDISVDRRLAHIQSSPRKTKSKKASTRSSSTKDAASAILEDDIDAANSLQIEAPVAELLAKGREGEQVAKADLWQCLFKNRPASQVPIQDQGVGQPLTTFMAGAAAEDRRQDAVSAQSNSSAV